MIVQYSNELYHHGVKGMKWGVRRYQKYEGHYKHEAYGGKITSDGKYKASNGIVVAKSKNKRAKLLRTITAFTDDSPKIDGLDRKTRERIKKERQALIEYRKAGGDKMLDKHSKGELKTVSGRKYRKEKIKAKTYDVRESLTDFSKNFYGSDLSRQAAKYMVDNNMPMREAIQKSKRKQWVNTAGVFMASYANAKIKSRNKEV